MIVTHSRVRMVADALTASTVSFAIAREPVMPEQSARTTSTSASQIRVKMVERASILTVHTFANVWPASEASIAK
jgi:hypothetical protein